MLVGDAAPALKLNAHPAEKIIFFAVIGGVHE